MSVRRARRVDVAVIDVSGSSRNMGPAAPFCQPAGEGVSLPTVRYAVCQRQVVPHSVQLR